MKYKGKIDKIDRIIISDPSYDKNVTCRYEKNNINGANWDVNFVIHDVSDKVSDSISINGIEFFVLLHKENEHCQLKENGSFSYYSKNEIKETDIGMDTACVAFGINKYANDIENSREDWQPDCALNTLTDGLFGYVKEGSCNNELSFIWFSGYITDDAVLSKEDVIDYIATQLEIKGLEKEINISEKDKNDIDIDI